MHNKAKQQCSVAPAYRWQEAKGFAVAYVGGSVLYLHTAVNLPSLAKKDLTAGHRAGLACLAGQQICQAFPIEVCAEAC